MAVFFIFGQSVGWRAVGVWQLLFSFHVLRLRKVHVGVEGREASFVLRGPLAVMVGIVSVGLAVMLLFFPEQTVMRLSS